MTWLEFFVLAAAVARLSIMLVEEEGPGKIFVHLRFYMGVRHTPENNAYGLHWWGDLFSCVWCMSVWVSAFLLVGYWLIPTVTFAVAVWLALSAVAMLLWSKINE